MKRLVTGGIRITFSLLLVGALGAGTASALPGDTDQDGAISCTEANQATAERFDRIDADQDKSVSMAEFEAGTGKNLEAMDADKSGMVDVQEYVTYWCGAPAKEAKASKKAVKKGKKSLHAKMDANRNGKVSGEECVAFWTVRFSEIDANKDGQVAKDEFGNKVVEWYAIADVDKDGAVTVTEYADYWVGRCQAEKIKKTLGSN